MKVGQSIVLRDSLSFGQFDLLNPKSQYGLMGGLSSDQSELYLSHGLVSRFQHTFLKMANSNSTYFSYFEDNIRIAFDNMLNILIDRHLKLLYFNVPNRPAPK